MTGKIVTVVGALGLVAGMVTALLLDETAAGVGLGILLFMVVVGFGERV